MNSRSMLAAMLLAAAGGVSALEGHAGQDALERFDIIDLVSDQTTLCRKEKDQSLCSNYFTEDGVIKRIMHDDDARRDGVWFIDDQDRLCILWKGKIKPLCFHVYEQDDGSYKLIKKGEHITTIIGTEQGNTRGL
ncbi:MAG: hypothetical protein KDI88_02615 [Gammaproteobacteria bacterium]|nr:hypothetical protein [Gammaproteobacteria bacterium]